MSTRFHSARRGSALLIVLGMLSFMLFSGLAFSVYMRQTRLPSSFLRRSATTRQLAKAAVAHAVDQLDAAIGNNPYPGVGLATGRGGANKWKCRVYTGVDTLPADPLSAGTVPTLNLEALAYLPPSIVNEVRYFSRLTPTAKWQKFLFDAGRYAYTAVNVSDCFDVNRILADRPRSSAASRRVSFAYLFEENGHRASGGAKAQAWDAWLEGAKVRKVDAETDAVTYEGCVPFVSVADFNLALGQKAGSFGKIQSPFCEWLKNAGETFYAGVGSGESDPQAEAYRSMAFVTDSYQPRTWEEGVTADGDEYLSLADGGNQPLPSGELLKEKSSVSAVNILNRQVPGGSTVAMDRLVSQQGQSKFLCSLGLFGLWDYLDADSVPLSLAVPTAERTPMVCGAQMNLNNLSFTIEEAQQDRSEATEGATRRAIVDYTYTLTPQGLESLGLKVATLYPFLHPDAGNPGAFKMDGMVGMFFSDGDVGLHLNGQYDRVPLQYNKLKDVTSTSVLNDSVLAIPVSAQGLSHNAASVAKSQDAVKVANVAVAQAMRSAGELRNKPLLKATLSWTQTKNEDSGAWEPADPRQAQDLEVTDVQCGLHPVQANGLPDDKYADTLKASMMQKDFAAGKTVKLNFALWLRVTSGEKTVDLVPASVYDDALNGGGSSGGMATMVAKQLHPGGIPLLRFSTDFELTLSMDGLAEKKATPAQVTVTPSTLMVADPRFNHEPSSWFAPGGELSESSWDDQAKRLYGTRDGDVFMATSDQGYLQSPYELAHLLRLTNPFGSSGSPMTGLYNASGRDEYATSPDGAVNAELMWSTYRPYKTSAGSADDFERIGFSTGDGGVRVNPYADSAVLMAALANTPHDWRSASTNLTQVVQTQLVTGDLSAEEYNKSYAWNAYSDDAGGKLAWDDLKQVAEEMRAKLGGATYWEESFRNLDWSGDAEGKSLLGVQLNGQSGPFFSVDRKFLYGFWKDCFAARQQLFLVFVRAEPMMMGGGVAGSAPPQLGTRAVALVWRDPSETANNTPHPTRVLFYHPLD